MASLRSLRGWALVHKWTSIVCAAFLLIFCVTGLPLIFTDELRELLSDDPPYADLPANTPAANLDRMIDVAKARYPDHVIWFVSIDAEEPQVRIGLLPAPDAPPSSARRIKFDARTGEVLKEVEPTATQPLTFLDLMLRLHKDLFADLPGQFFLAFMGLMFVLSTVSGLALYGPFMKKIDFGEVRRQRTKRIKWLDLHNLLGVVTVAWALVVGLTGILNELSLPLFQYWQRTEVQDILRSHRDQPVLPQSELASAQGAFDLVKRTLPDRTVITIVYPNSRVGSPHHYVVWTKGRSPLTARLFTPVLVEGRSGSLTTVVQMPWYLRAVQVSRPLHFGDYGGLPLKIIWALLDLATIAVLGSGLYLWLSRRRSPVEARLAELQEATRES